jgi:hypothetical protein
MPCSPVRRRLAGPLADVVSARFRFEPEESRRPSRLRMARERAALGAVLGLGDTEAEPSDVGVDMLELLRLCELSGRDGEGEICKTLAHSEARKDPGRVKRVSARKAVF